MLKPVKGLLEDFANVFPEELLEGLPHLRDSNIKLIWCRDLISQIARTTA